MARLETSRWMHWARKLGIACAAVGLIIGGGLFAAPALFDFTVWQQRVMQTLKDTTGQDASIAGTPGISLFPEPMIVFYDVSFGAATAPEGMVVRIPRLEVRFGWMGAFSSDVSTTRLLLREPEMTVRESAARPSAAMALFHAVKKMQSASGYASALDIENGVLRATGTSRPLLEGLSLHVPLTANATVTNFTLNALHGGVPLTLEAAIASDTLPSEALQVDSTLVWGGQSIRFEGKADNATAGAGKLSLRSDDAAYWWRLARTLFGTLPAMQPGIALELSGIFQWNPQGVGLTDIVLKSGKTQASGSLILPETGGSVQLAFDALDLEPWVAAANAEKSAVPFTIPPILKTSVSLSAKAVHLKGQTIADATLEGELADGAVTLNRVHFMFPGNGEALFIGIVQPKDGGASLDGRFEVQGESLRDFAAAFSLTPLALEKAESGRYRTVGNVLATPKEVRISEMRMLLERQQCVGSLVFYLENPVRLEAALGLKSIDMDRWVEAVRARKRELPSMPKESDPLLAFDYSWLSDIPWDATFNVRIDDVTFRSMHADSLAFRARIKPGEFSFSELTGTLGGTEIKGAGGLNVKSERPRVSAELAVGEVDDAWWDRFISAEAAPKTPDQPEAAVPSAAWSREQWRFPFIAAHDGAVKLTFKQAALGGIFLTGGLLDAELAGSSMKINALKAGVWDGGLEASGTLNAGAVPALSGQVVLAGVNVARFFGNWTRLASLDGVMGANGSFSMSGLTPYNWVSSLNGNMTIGGQNIVVTGFDLPSIVQAVAAVRSVADIINITRLSFPGGKTVFPTVQGLLNAERGKVSFVNFGFLNELARGKVEGSIALPEWTTDATTTLELPTLGQEEHPSLQFHMTGPADAPAIALDTRLLEAYVARVAAQRMMNKPMMKNQ